MFRLSLPLFSLLLSVSVIHICYGASSPDCSSITGCDKCHNSGVTCDMCLFGTLAVSNGTKCIDCPQYCFDCKENSEGKAYCGECLPGYFASEDGSTCMDCPPRCHTCDDVECSKCVPGFHLNADSVECKACPPRCISCSDATTCLQCVQGYQLDGSMHCKKCQANCLECANDICSQCSPGYFWDGTDCTECLTSCKTCNDGSTCEECLDGHYLNQAKDTCAATMNCRKYQDEVGCVGCQYGYHLMTDKSCKACPAVSSNTCRKCMSATRGHFWDTNFCQKCPKNCLICQEADSCSRCAPDHVWDDISKVCVACSSATLDGASKCNSCSEKYWDGDSCEVCPADRNQATSMEICTNCLESPGAFWAVGVCSDVDCTASASSLTEAECNACDTKRWDGTACVELDCSVTPATEEECVACDGMIWEPSSSCDYPDCSAYAFDNELACAHCPIKMWDASTQTCKGLTCGTHSTQPDCDLCDGFTWNSGTGQCEYLVVNCYGGSLDTEEKCKACSLLQFYWDSGTCQQSTAQDCASATTEAVCNSCRNRHWDGIACVDVVCSGLLDTEAKCLKCMTQHWDQAAGVCNALDCSTLPDNQEECLSCPVTSWDASSNTCSYMDCTTSTPATEEDCFACRLYGYKWSGSSCDSYNCASNNQTTKDDCDWCGPLKAFTAAGCKAVDCANPASLNEAQCMRCSALRWDGSACIVTNCSDTLTTEEECAACHMTKYWDGSACLDKFDCATTFIDSEAKCISCTTSTVGKIWDASAGQCVSCPPGCAACNPSNQCLSCEKGKFWNPTSSTCEDCSSATPDTEAACNSCSGYVWEGGACTACPANCKSCSDSSSCDFCDEGLVWDATALKCTDCLLDTETECLQCVHMNSGNYFDNGECEACPLGCVACDSADMCTECATGFYLHTATSAGQTQTTTCMACSGLSAGDLDTKEKCTRCGIVHGKYWDANASPPQCTDCDDNCQICSVTDGCKRCNEGYRLLANGACSACIEGCSKCADDTTCQMCLDGRCLDEDKTACHQTPNGFPPCALCTTSESETGGTDVQCVECPSDHFMEVCQACSISNCVDCEYNVDECVKCRDGYYLNSDSGQCMECPGAPNCLECADNSKCGRCRMGFYYHETDNTCKACIVGCSQCSDGTTCDKCVWGKAYNSDTKKCVDCPASCHKCEIDENGDAQCTKCMPTHYLKDKSCRACNAEVPNCASCDDNGKCDYCEMGFVLNEAGTVCSQCNIDKCGKCIDPPLMCDSCTDNLEVTADGDACVKACYSCDGDKECALARTGLAEKELCPGLGDTHSCWIQADFEGEDIEEAKVKRMCSNMTCNDEFKAINCLTTDNKQQCKMCCMDSLCNARVYAGNKDGAAATITQSLFLVSLTIVLAIVGTMVTS